MMLLCTRLMWISLILFIVPVHVFTKEDENNDACTLSYKKGVGAYLANQFQDCVENIEDALKKYHSYTAALQYCRLKCAEETELSDPLYPVDVEDLRFYEKTLKTTLCIIKCRKLNEHTAETSTLSAATMKIFEQKKPYEYLHLCYYQIKQAQKAASAAFTYLVTHPKDDAMIKNLKHYSNQTDVDMSEIINFEAKDFVYLYIHGVDAYEKKDWKGVEENMEESLILYLQAEEECRSLCEGPFIQGWFPDFIPSIANHFTFCLKCKRKCQHTLNNLNGEFHEDLLPSHYHYLQYAYYKLGNLKAACQASASYILFYPDDEIMRSNIEFYKKVPKVVESYFTPRPEAVRYVRRYTYEARLLNFVQTEYNFDESTSPEVKENPSKDQPSSVDEQSTSV